MSFGNTAERQLQNWMERDGNWRFKALLSAALPEHPFGADEIGRAMINLEKNPETKRYHLSKRDEDDPFRQETKYIRPLSYDDADYNEPTYARELADDGHFDERELEQGVSVDEYMGRMLTSGSTQEKDVLWREQLLDTVIEGAREVQFARDNTNFVEVNTRKGDHPVQGDDVFAPKVAEGAGIQFDELDWSQQSWDTEKRGLGAYITEELIDHALIDVIEQNIRHLGRAVENSFNRITINELVDNANESVSFTTSSTDGMQNANLSYIFDARDSVVKDSWPEPDSMIMHNKFELGFIQEDRNNINFAQRAGTGEYVRDAALPPVANIDNMLTVPGSVYDGSNTYDWSGTSGDRGAVVYNQDLMYTYMYRDLETKDFEDPIRDLEGANVRAQYDAALGQTDSACRIEET